MTEPVSRRIVLASFTSPTGAAATLDLLKGGAVRLGNTAVVTRNASGEVAFTESADWGVGKSALIGAIAGLLLPGVGTITLAAGGALAAYFIDLGFPDALLKHIGEGLAADSSMLVLLVADDDVAQATQLITQAHGTVVGTSTEQDLTAAVAQLRPTA
jgi:uncharacterized membrane protein